MNSVSLTGRLTKDIEVRYTSSQMAVGTFTLAVYRDKDNTDFIRIKTFGKTAENCEKYTSKGSQVAIQGEIQTGSYENKDGKTVYTTDVVANKVEFLSKAEKKEEKEEGYSAIEEDIPF